MTVANGVTVIALDADMTLAVMPALVDILRDSVNGGASVGFLPPLDEADALEYWAGVVVALKEGNRVLLAARAPVVEGRVGFPGAPPSDGGVWGAISGPPTLIGTAQLDLCPRANGRHRAEVMKVMVLTAARRRGVGRTLMDACDAHARRLGRTTLVLDTRQGDPSEHVYRSAGWTFAGAVPRYARSADGTLHATAFYYKLLEGDAR